MYGMIVIDMRPLSMIEDDAFTTIIYTLSHGYTVPSRTHFKTNSQLLKLCEKHAEVPPFICTLVFCFVLVCTEMFLGGD